MFAFMIGIRRKALYGTLLAAVAVAGCNSGDSGDGIAREALSGKVTLDGAPLNNASIQFMPSDANGAGTSGQVTGGAFSIPKERGAAPGGYKVLISSVSSDQGSATEAPGPQPKPKPDPIPKKYNVNSTLNAEVKAGGPNEFTFTLETK